MKKTLICMMLSSFILTGCNSNTVSGSIKTEFELNAKINYNNLISTATISRDISTFKIEFTSPPSIKGITYKFEDNKLTVNFNGLNCDVEDKASIRASASEIIYSSIENAIPKSDKQEISSITENGAYTLTIHDWVPKKLTLQDKKFSCEFNKI